MADAAETHEVFKGLDKRDTDLFFEIMHLKDSSKLDNLLDQIINPNMKKVANNAFQFNALCSQFIGCCDEEDCDEEDDGSPDDDESTDDVDGPTAEVDGPTADVDEKTDN